MPVTLRSIIVAAAWFAAASVTLVTAPTQSSARDDPGSEMDQVLLEVQSTNWAEKAKYTGFYLDATGKVYRYDRQGRFWNPADRAAITVRELSEKYTPINELHSTYPAEEVQQLIAKIDAAARGPLSKRKNVCFDAGAVTFLAYAYDGGRGTYRPVLLRQEGDWAQENTSLAAKELVSYIRSLGLAGNAGPCSP